MTGTISFRMAPVVLLLAGLAASTGPRQLLVPGGSIDAAFNVGTGFNNAGDAGVLSVVPASDGSGDVYIGGNFTSYNGTAINRIVRLNSDGTIDAGFNVGTGFPDSPYLNIVHVIALAQDGSGDVYVGGRFFSYNGTESGGIVRLNSNGTIDAAFNVGPGFTNEGVRAIAPAQDGSDDVYVGGTINSYNGSEAPRLIRLNSDGTVDAAFNLGGFNSGYGIVNAIALAPDGSGDVYVGGGSFTDYNGGAINGLVRLNSDGSIDTAFNVGTGFVAVNNVSSVVDALAPASDGSSDLYVGGQFTSYNGTPVNRIVRLNSNGTIDAGFYVGTGLSGSNNQLRVWTLAIADDGSEDVYVAGEFNAYNGTSSNRIVRLNSDGTIDSLFGVGTGFNGAPRSLALDSSGDVYAVGPFGNYNGTATNGIVRLNGDGVDSSAAPAFADTFAVTHRIESGIDPYFGTGIR